MTTEQQTSTPVSLTPATTQAPVTTVSSNTPISGIEISLGVDTVPSSSLPDIPASATHSGFLVPVSAIDQERSGDAALQTNSKNVLGTQSSTFSLSNLPLPAPDVLVTAEQLQAVRLWLQQATTNFNQRLNVGQCVSQPESVSHTTRHDILTSQIDTTAHLAHTSVQSRPHFSRHIILQLIVPLRPTLRRLMFHCLRQVYMLSIAPPRRVFNSERVYPPVLLVVVFTT